MFLYDYASSAVVSSALKERVRRWLPKRLKRHKIHAGPLSGCAIVTSWHDYPGAILGRTEKPLLEWFRQHVKSTQGWVDIGAHYGYTAIALARLVGEQGRVFAFEPILETAACLARTRDINNFSQLTVFPLGLCADPMFRTERLPTVPSIQSALGRVVRVGNFGYSSNHAHPTAFHHHHISGFRHRRFRLVF